MLVEKVDREKGLVTITLDAVNCSDLAFACDVGVAVNTAMLPLPIHMHDARRFSLYSAFFLVAFEAVKAPGETSSDNELPF